MSVKLFNAGYSGQYLTLDPVVPNYGLHAATAGETALLFDVTNINSTTFQRYATQINGTELCLDVYGGDSTNVHLATCGNFLGQQWWSTTVASGVKLSNNYTGGGWYLDVFSDNDGAHMSQGDLSGQYWQLVEESAQPTAAASSVTASNPAPAATSSIGNSASTTTPMSPFAANPASDSLSTGAKAGIGVGAAVGGILIIFVAALLLMQRIKRRTADVHRSREIQDDDHSPRELDAEESKVGSRAKLAELSSPIAELPSSNHAKHRAELEATGG